MCESQLSDTALPHFICVWPGFFPWQMPCLLNWLFKIYTKYNHVPFHNFKHCFMVSQMVSFCYIYCWWWCLIPRRQGLLGSMMVNSCMLMVAVETDSLCARPTALWTDEGLGWGWWGCCSLFLRLGFFLCGFSALNAQLAFLTDECQLFWSEASCCHNWWLIPACTSCLFTWSL